MAGEAITAGQAIYIHTDNKAYKADTTTAAKAAARGIAVNSAPAANQPVSYCSGGDLAMGSVLTASVAYCVSDTAGGVRPAADNGSGDFITQIGLAKSATLLNVKINALAVQV